MCNKHYTQEWLSRPEVKAHRARKQRERREDPAVREAQSIRAREIYQERDNTEKKAKKREYMREKYSPRPEVKARIRQYNDSYFSRPEIMERERSRMRARRAGFFPGLVETLRAHQRGRCAICPAEIHPEVKRSECADHCHTSGKARGLLCLACNTGLGFYEKQQRPAGLVIGCYENYLQNPPADLFRP